MLSTRGLKTMLLMASKSGDVSAQFELGVLYKTGDRSTPPNYIAAKRWLTLAANNGHIDANKHLAELHRNGLGVEQNFNLADEFQQRYELLVHNQRISETIKQTYSFKNSAQNNNIVASKQTDAMVPQKVFRAYCEPKANVKTIYSDICANIKNTPPKKQSFADLPPSVRPENYPTLSKIDPSLDKSTNDEQQISVKTSYATLLDYLPFNIVKQLQELIGMAGIKMTIENLVCYLAQLEKRQHIGLKQIENPSLHSLFLGNSGTGKTTIAHIMGQIFSHLNILKTGHVVKINLNDLAINQVDDIDFYLNQQIDKAIGGILFFDLDFNIEQLEQDSNFYFSINRMLSKLIDYDRGLFVVIVAGSPQFMQYFIKYNSDLSRKFGQHIVFDDFNPNELIEIYQIFLKKEGYFCTADALMKIRQNFEQNYLNRDNSFSNAHFVQKSLISHQENLVSRLNKQLNSGSKEDLQTIIIKDV